ncbi:hypothetical protein [Streptomyces sp. SID12501]|uniref:Uncharacterized protein n=1 Tax=Streptomyces sp. SID12501 TaxID=2706042 RepID=A0A6B3C088_9ACTN|nr:hypothetical protein [Streptomyces sp. SID12501]NEC90133.1 hypothetical protein [Streptomyces sp. SID12501]
MSALPGGDVASGSSAAGTIGLLDAGRTGEPMAERLPAVGPRSARTRGGQRPAITQSMSRVLATGRVMGVEESTLFEVPTVRSGGNTTGRRIVARGGSACRAYAVTPFLRQDLATCRDTAAEMGALSKLLTAAMTG